MANSGTIPASPPVVKRLTFAQLEGLWIQAGGDTAVAPTMAAIALAESGGIPNRPNWGDTNGKGGSQASLGLWQISNGTSQPFSPNWADPLTNAKAAVAKYKSQGFGAWGAYTNGSYKTTLPNGYIAPDANGIPSGGASSSGFNTVSSTGVSCYWKIDLSLTTICMDPLLWSGLIVIGALTLIAGAAFTAIAIGSESKTVRDVASTAAKVVPVMKVGKAISALGKSKVAT